MNYIKTGDLKSLNNYNEAYVTIGNFDGLHIGHIKIIKAMKKDAGGGRTIAVTFEESTSLYVNPEKFKGYLFPEGYKIKALSLAGIDEIISLDFNRVAGIEARDFIELFRDKIGKLHFYVGSDFRFGKGNSGSIHTIQEAVKDENLTLKVIEKRRYHFSAVSSSLIREKILCGELEAAAAMLGRPYFIISRKIPGDGIGKKTGYPTINLEINRQVLPQIGVYFSLFYINERFYPSMTYVGSRPTFSSHEIRNETNIVDYDGDFSLLRNNEKYCVLYIKKIRNEKKFHNLDDLNKTIYNDKRKVIKLYSEYKSSGKLPEAFMFL